MRHFIEWETISLDNVDSGRLIAGPVPHLGPAERPSAVEYVQSLKIALDSRLPTQKVVCSDVREE